MEKLLKEKLKNEIKKQWGIEVGKVQLDVIIHDKQKMKMFKEMGYV